MGPSGLRPQCHGGPRRSPRAEPVRPVAEIEYTIPGRSGETLFVPPLDRLRSLVAPYEPDGAAAVLDTPLDEFRRRTRERVLDLAARAGACAPGRGAGPAGGTGWRDPAAGPIVLMGHQPIFLHPGVWVKYFLLSRLCGVKGAVSLHCIVDTDATGPVSADIPAAREGRVARVVRTLVPLAGDVPLEAAAPPSAEAWSSFAGQVRADLGTLRSAALVERFEAFTAGEPVARREAATLAAYLGALRREYEGRAGAPRYADITASALASTPEFHAFALHLVQEPRALREMYNGCLDAYREAHRIRSAANPFPNVGESGGRVETPFWILHGGRRTDLFAARDGGRLILGSADAALATIPAGPGGVEALAGSGLTLRPKALTLTMFARLCLADLFVHGVGGGRYDRVTDALTQRVFGVRPAPYAVATATLHLPLGEAADPAAERHALERRLMDLRHNPDRHLSATGEVERRLIDEKWALIHAVETMRPGLERRAATRRIRDINGALAGALAPEIERVEARLASLRAEPAAEDALQYRGYPFFLFDPAEVRALVHPEPPRA